MKPIPFIMCIVLGMPWAAFAQTTQPVIGITTDFEDGKKMVHAAVALNGKPMQNVVLQYFVRRTFGNILLGEDTTLDDGSSAVTFPSDLPGAPDGKLHLIVQIKTPAQYSSASSSVAFPANVRSAPTSDAFPRALWAPHAPLALMLTIFGVLAAIWLSYLFVVSRILAIRMGGQQ